MMFRPVCGCSATDPAPPRKAAAWRSSSTMSRRERQKFHTAFNGLLDFANGILRLRNAGANVIVDDVIYFAENMFSDGIIAQAADRAVAAAPRISRPPATTHGSPTRPRTRNERGVRWWRKPEQQWRTVRAPGARLRYLPPPTRFRRSR